MNLAEQNFVDVSNAICKLREMNIRLNFSNNSLKRFLKNYDAFHSISIDIRKSDTESLIAKYQTIIDKTNNLIVEINVEAKKLNESIKEAKIKERIQEEKIQNQKDNKYFINKDVS